MRHLWLNIRGWGIGACAALVTTFGVAAAQDAPRGGTEGAEITARRDVALTPPQMEAKLDEYLPRMEQGATKVRRQLEQSRAARDVVKMLCLNDKLNQIDVAIRSAGDRAASLRVAISRNDVDRSRHEFTVVEVLHDRVRDLVGEADECIGEEHGFLGESSVTVEVDATIPEDPTKVPEEPLITMPPTISLPPSVASPIH